MASDTVTPEIPTTETPAATRKTPLPWFVEDSGVFDKDGKFILIVAALTTDAEEDSALAEYIARAVNCHAELLASANKMLAALDAHELIEIGALTVIAAIPDLRAAIAKATGGQS
jgi:hypothetical protein